MSLDPNETPAELKEGHDALLAQVRQGLSAWPSSETRKGKARRREKILNECFGDVIAEKLQETYYNAEIKSRMRRHVSVEVNLGADITRALACVYKQPPIRRFKDGTDDENAALIGINEATKWACKAESINRQAWFTGPVLEMPVVRRKVLSRHVLPCSVIDVQVTDDDPLGHPVAAAYPWHENGKPCIKVVDQETIRTYGLVGDEYTEEAHGCVEPDGKTPRFPGTLWRFDDPLSINDYWSRDRNERLVSATISAGTIYTTMDWVRKGQNRKLMVAMGNLKNLANGSGMDNETPAFWNVSDEDEMPKFDVVDVITPVDQFIAQIGFIAQVQIEGHGIPSSAITFNFGEAGGDMAVMALSLQHDQLTQLRNKQIRYAAEAEKRSQYNACALAKHNGLPLAEGLPDLSELADRLEVKFTDLTRIEDPATTQAELDWKLKRGMTTDAHIYQESHPELTLEEAKAEVLKNLKTQAEFNELKARENLDPAAEMLDGNEATGGLRSDPEPEPEPEKEL